MKTFYLKRGETFKVAVTLKDSLNQTIDLPAEKLSAQLRDNFGNLIDNFGIIKDSENIGTYILSLFNTNNYPIENLKFDIKVNVNKQDIAYSQTFTLSVLLSETNKTEEITIYTLKMELDELQLKVQEIEEKIDNNTDNISVLNEEIVDLKEETDKIPTIETNIENLNTAVSNTVETVHSMSETVSSNSQSIETINSSIQNIETNVETNTNDISSLDSRVTELEEGSSSSGIDLNDVKNYLEALDTNIIPDNGETVNIGETGNIINELYSNMIYTNILLAEGEESISLSSNLIPNEYNAVHLGSEEYPFYITYSRNASLNQLYIADTTATNDLFVNSINGKIKDFSFDGSNFDYNDTIYLNCKYLVPQYLGTSSLEYEDEGITYLGKADYQFKAVYSEEYFQNGNKVLDTSSTLASSKIDLMTGYSKPQQSGAISTNDTLNQAIGKLERKIDDILQIIENIRS